MTMENANPFREYFFNRISSQKEFLAYTLEEDLERTAHVIGHQLKELGVDRETRLLLGTARTPQLEDEDFESQVQQIAEHFKANYEPLLYMIRQVQFLDRFRGNRQVNDHEPSLQAAREREDEEENDG